MQTPHAPRILCASVCPSVRSARPSTDGRGWDGLKGSFMLKIHSTRRRAAALRPALHHRPPCCVTSGKALPLSGLEQELEQFGKAMGPHCECMHAHSRVRAKTHTHTHMCALTRSPACPHTWTLLGSGVLVTFNCEGNGPSRTQELGFCRTWSGGLGT